MHDPPVIRPDQARYKVECRGLSRAVRAEQADDLALLDPDGDVVHHLAALEALQQIHPLQHARRGRLCGDRLRPLGRTARRVQQGFVDALACLGRLSPPGHPRPHRVPVAAGRIEDPALGGQARQHRARQVIAHLVAGDLDLHRSVERAVAGDVRLAVAHDEVAEIHRVRHAGRAGDRRQSDRHRGVAIAEGCDPFRGAHRATRLPEAESAGAADVARCSRCRRRAGPSPRSCCRGASPSAGGGGRRVRGAGVGLELDTVDLAAHVHPIHARSRRRPGLHRDRDRVAPRVVDRRPLRQALVGLDVIGLGGQPRVDSAQHGALGAGGVTRGESGDDRVPPHPVAILRGRVHTAAEPGLPEAAHFLELLVRRVERERVGFHRVGGRGGRGPRAVSPGQCLFQLPLVDVEGDGVGDEIPFLADRPRFPLREEVAQLPLVQRQVDPRSRDREAVGSDAPERRRISQQRSVAARSRIEPQRVRSRGEVAPIDRHLAAREDPVVTPEAHPLADDDVRLRRCPARVGREILDGGAAGGVHLERVADALHHPEIVQRRALQRGAGLEVLGRDVAPCFPSLLVLVVDAPVGVHGQCRVAVLHPADELHHVAAVGGHAVALHGDPGAAAAQLDVPAREVVGPLRGLHHAPLAVDVVDLEDAPLALGRERRRRRERGDPDRNRPVPHGSPCCPGSSMPSPATPRGRSVTTFLKSGSERKLLPSRCSSPRSKVKCRSVEI